jgi:hypothetical protein
MKKTVPLTLAAIFLYSIVFGQRPLPAYRNEDLKIKNFSRRIVEFESLKEPVYLQNIRSIEVIDARPDTMAIGLALISKHIPFFAVSQSAFASDVHQFLNSSIHFTQPDSFSVLMVIKKFWLTGGLDEEMEQQIQNSDIDSSSKKIGSVLARIEFYLKMGTNHFILYRYDTTITKNIYVSKEASVLVEQALISSLSKLKEMDSKFQNISETKRKFSWDEIESHDQKRFDIPILKDSAHIRGVYFSFEEFKNNNPGQRDFEVEKDKLIDLIFVKQADGKLAPIRDSWGYCDGKNLYIRSMENYFLLQREGNAFYIYGSKEFKHKKVARDPGMGTGSNTAGGTTHYTNPLEKTSKRHLALELKPYELDWDDGELN